MSAIEAGIATDTGYSRTIAPAAPLGICHDWSPAAWSWLWARDLLDVIDRLRADLREAPECA